VEGLAARQREEEAGPILAWDAAHRGLRVQVFGAGGAAGREITAALLARGHPRARLSLFGRRGRSLDWRGESVRISPVPAQLAWAELAFLCTPPDVAARLAPVLTRAGTRVIDLSGAFRARADLPLVAPEIDPGELGAFTQLVALPSRSASVLVRPLWALERAVGLEEVVCTALFSAAAVGGREILELRSELEARQEGEEAHASTGLVANVRSVPGAAVAGGDAVAELELAGELGRLLHRPDLPMDLTGLRTDVERCDAFVLALRTRDPVTPAGAAEALAAFPGIQVEEGPEGPAARSCVGSDLVHVGRIRAGSRGATSLCCFAVGDQLRLGAANAALLAASILPVG